MVNVYSDIIIDCPREIVAEYASDPNNAPEWYVNIKSAEILSPGPLKEGAKIAFRAKFMGRLLEYTYEIVEYSSGFHLVMRNYGKPKGFSRLARPMIALMMKRANRKDLINLKEILERRKEN